MRPAGSPEELQRRREGVSGVAARPTSGRLCALAEKHKHRLEALLLKGAQACGFSTDLWTCAQVAQVVRDRSGVNYHVDHIGRLRHALGWSPQKPTRLALERDEATIVRWIKEDWPRIKKRRAPQRGARLHRRSGFPDGAAGEAHLVAPRTNAGIAAAGPFAVQEAHGADLGACQNQPHGQFHPRRTSGTARAYTTSDARYRRESLVAAFFHSTWRVPLRLK